MKRTVAFVIAAFILFTLAGCAAPQQPAAPSSASPAAPSADVGKEMEQFGFVFTIPQGVTSNGLDDGIYDIDFGAVGQREAFIGINPPEDLTGKGSDEEDLLQLYLDGMRQAVSDYFDDIRNDIMETRELDGNPAGHIGLDCTINGVPVHWQIYMVVLGGTLHSFTIQIYSNAITDGTLATINRFVSEIQLVSTPAL